MKIFGNTVFTFSKKQQTYIDVPSERSDSSVKMSNEENSIALSFEVCDTTEKMEQQTASTIEEMLKERGFSVESVNNFPMPTAITSFSFTLVKNYAICSEFYKEIRTSFSNPEHKGYYARKNNQDDRTWNKILEIGDLLNSMGIFTKYYRTLQKIMFTTTTAPKAINYINGSYLENYSAKVISDVLEELSIDRRFEDYELLQNVVIKDESGNSHELDCVMRIGNELFWAEIKSGKCSDFDKYRKIGLSLGVNPDCHILLLAEGNNDTCSVLSYFYECFISNISTFKNDLRTMFRNAIERSLD